MPRLSPRLFHEARRIHPWLPFVLKATRDVVSARNELRWLQDHAIDQAKKQYPYHHHHHNHHQHQHRCSNRQYNRTWRSHLRQLCIHRGQSEPLQYLIGTEYFGDLEIICRPGVLIPRQETAASITHLVRRIARNDAVPARLGVLDLCTGTGCIPLLFENEFRRRFPSHSGLRLLGIDISPKAVNLAQHNQNVQQREGASLTSLDFALGNVLAARNKPDSVFNVLHKHSGSTASSSPQWDVLISNPPYISPSAFNRTTSRSVRNHEPRLALVPFKQDSHTSDTDQGDAFYPRLLEIADEVKAKLVFFEVADMEQAHRVASMMQQHRAWDGIEIWRDDPGQMSDAEDGVLESSHVTSSTIPVLGRGNGRSVVAWRGDADLSRALSGDGLDRGE